MARSADSLRQMGVMDPSLERALRVRPFPEMPEDYIEHRKARAAHLNTLRHLMPVPGPIPEQVAEREILIPAEDGYKIRVIHYAPTKRVNSPLPVIVLFHEGGWGMGDLSDEEFNARLLTRDLGVVCLNVEYRLAPEHPFPIGIKDCWSVILWITKNDVSIGADASKGFIVGGSSAGGNISAVLSQMSADIDLQPPISGQWLSVPYLTPSRYVPEKYKGEFLSMTENASDPVVGAHLNSDTEAALTKALNIDLSSPLFSVLAKEYYPPADDGRKLKGQLARAFIQVAGLDPLRDHGLIYDRILRLEYGTDTRVEVYPGFGHMFWTNWPELDVSKKFTDDMVEGFKWLLGISGE